MLTLNNALKLWTFVSEEIVESDAQQYSEKTFIDELPRLSGQLYINGISSDSIFRKATNQIKLVEKCIHAICSAAEILKKEPGEIVKACKNSHNLNRIFLFQTRNLRYSKYYRMLNRMEIFSI